MRQRHNNKGPAEAFIIPSSDRTWHERPPGFDWINRNACKVWATAHKVPDCLVLVTMHCLRHAEIKGRDTSYEFKAADESMSILLKRVLEIQRSPEHEQLMRKFINPSPTEISRALNWLWEESIKDWGRLALL